MTRNGLKIPRSQGCAGSIPAPGTSKLDIKQAFRQLPSKGLLSLVNLYANPSQNCPHFIPTFPMTTKKTSLDFPVSGPLFILPGDLPQERTGNIFSMQIISILSAVQCDRATRYHQGIAEYHPESVVHSRYAIIVPES